MCKEGNPLQLTQEQINMVQKELQKPYIQQQIQSKKLDWFGDWALYKIPIIQYLYDNGHSDLLEWSWGNKKITQIPRKFFTGISLKSLDVPENITSVCQYAFWGADIGAVSFKNCTNLVELPGYLFAKNKNFPGYSVKNVALPPNLEMADKTFFDAPDDIRIFLANKPVNLQITPNDPKYIEWIVRHIPVGRYTV